MPESNPVHELLQSEETGELLEAQDKAEIEKHIGQDKALDAEVAEEVKTLANQLHAATRRPGQSAGSGDHGGGAASKRPRRYPPAIKVPDTDIPRACAAFLPPTCTIYADNIDQSWRLEAYERRFSRAWRLYGKKKAAELLIEIAWQRAIRLGHEVECPFAELKLTSSTSS